ncbi:sodium-dependent transporter [Miniphocaeibacter massiliensis]|uniref:sodium-dependent transporter n=1 Tax=Miniphocaeibacter massiliensis TaxID=2041841 RepID=UPI000C1B7E45|nr:sodium-dependent transporter [Miniphocaeibacter massiliensis]
MSDNLNNEKGFSSKWGFILACVGSAVGMANIWGFPYRMAANGGGAFLLIYIIFVVLFSNVALSAEFAIGRRSQTGTVGSYEKAWESRGKGKIGQTLGFIPLAGSMCIAIGYAIIVGLALRGLWQSITGELFKTAPEALFASGTGDFGSTIFHVIIVVGTLLTLFLGAASIEKSNKVMMPLLIIIFLVLAIRVAFLPGAIEGYKYMFIPRWEYILKAKTWIMAMGQAFFSLSVTGSGMIVYGAYLSKKEDIVMGARQTALFDSLVALLASAVIIPAIFANNIPLEDASGPGLLFIILPTILKAVPFGRIFAIILFIAVVFAGISSLQNMFEVVGESLMYRFKKLKRSVTLVILAIICLGFGIFMENINTWGPWMDIVSIYIIPIGAVIGGFSWFWVLKKQELLDEINLGAAKQQGSTWYAFGKYVFVPIAIFVCVYSLATGTAL